MIFQYCFLKRKHIQDIKGRGKKEIVDTPFVNGLENFENDDKI